MISGAGRPRRLAVWVMPISGARRLRSTSTPSALSGEMYSTRVFRLGALPPGWLPARPGRGSRPGSASGSAGGGDEQPVQRPEEGRERLAGAGGGDDEGVRAGGDGVPGAVLGRGGRGKSAQEPVPGRPAEPVHGVGRECAAGELLPLHSSIMPYGTDSIRRPSWCRGSRAVRRPAVRRSVRAGTARSGAQLAGPALLGLEGPDGQQVDVGVAAGVPGLGEEQRGGVLGRVDPESCRRVRVQSG